jgi:hypothetical protein
MTGDFWAFLVLFGSIDMAALAGHLMRSGYRADEAGLQVAHAG